VEVLKYCTCCGWEGETGEEYEIVHPQQSLKCYNTYVNGCSAGLYLKGRAMPVKKDRVLKFCTDCGWVGYAGKGDTLVHPDQSQLCLNGDGHLEENSTDIRFIVWKVREEERRKQRNRRKRQP
jgi:hypothetical protein